MMEGRGERESSNTNGWQPQRTVGPIMFFLNLCTETLAAGLCSLRIREQILLRRKKSVLDKRCSRIDICQKKKKEKRKLIFTQS